MESRAKGQPIRRLTNQSNGSATAEAYRESRRSFELRPQVVGLVGGIIISALGLLLGFSQLCSISIGASGGGCVYPSILPLGTTVAGIVILIGSMAAMWNSSFGTPVPRGKAKLKLLVAAVPAILVSVALAATPPFALDDGDLPTAWGLVLYGGAALICVVVLSRFSYALSRASPRRKAFVLSIVLFTVVAIAATAAFSPPDRGIPMSVKQTVSEMHCYNFASPEQNTTGSECDEVGFAVVYSPFQVVIDSIFWLSLGSLLLFGALAGSSVTWRPSRWTAVSSLYAASLLAPTVSAEANVSLSLAARWSHCSASVCHGFNGQILLADYGFWFVVSLIGASLVGMLLTAHYRQPVNEIAGVHGLDRKPAWPTRRVVLAVALVACILVAGFAIVSLGPSTKSTNSSTVYSIGASGTSIENQSVGLGLGLHLRQGSDSGLIVTVTETNLLQRASNITGVDRWPIPSTLLGQDCPPTPFGFGVFSGYLGANNYTLGKNYNLGKVLFLYNTDEKTLPSCHWNSVPLPHNFVGAGENDTLSATLQGYWTGGLETGVPVTFHAFGPGRYTVLAVDEWGQLTIAHFEVETAPTKV
jgi:hypothetical protein